MPQKIQLEQISLAADRPLVSDVSFTLRRGQVLALLGSSGCGKSLTCAAARVRCVIMLKSSPGAAMPSLPSAHSPENAHGSQRLR